MVENALPTPLTTSMDLLATAGSVLHQNDNIELVLGILMFVVGGFVFAFAGLLLGRFVRPKVPHPEKGAPYECGEPTIGPSWVQFDLRFYTVALVFIVFDVEIALLWPWAVVFAEMGGPAFWAFFFFFLLLAIPFAYELSSGYLEWVYAVSDKKRTTLVDSAEAPASLPADAPA